MRGRIAFAVAMTTVLCSVAEAAACQPDDLIGKWSMSVVGVSSNDTFVGLCSFRIAANGGIRGSCEAHDLEGSFSGRIAGSFLISRSCRVSGNFTTQDLPSVVKAKINNSKDVITGISLSSGTINQFTAVRQ